MLSSAGWGISRQERVLGAWWNGERYASNMIDDFNHWSTGWVDWNMALSMLGGPSWVGNSVTSPIIVDKDSGEFFKQPMYYVMGHFSKYIKRGSVRIYSGISGSQNFKSVAFHRPNDNISIIVLLNSGDSTEAVSVDLGNSVDFINFDMTEKSVVTILSNKPTFG
ncbi:hypothetical protein SK128_027484 [Halocaridina rubra]|uniref:Glucosylceramidase n=1 Tax=Halocaridina rubra TaxID=373956 RepID=A0AAN9AG55_HALRR